MRQIEIPTRADARVRCMSIRPRLILIAALVTVTLAPIAARKPLDLDAATIADINVAFKAGTLTSERLVQMYLARIDAYNVRGPNLRAVISLHGIPVILKDNIDTADMPTTGGSLLLEHSVPPDDAFVVKKLREAGAVIVGKSNMSEFAS